MTPAKVAKHAETERKALGRLTICLDDRATADLQNIAEVCERRNGILPSRSQIVRAALRAYYEAVK